MRRFPCLLAVFALFLLIVPISIALDPIEIESTPIKDRIMPGEWAIFNMSISNNLGKDAIFKISIQEEGTEWSVLTEPTSDYSTGVNIKGAKKKNIRLLLKDNNLQRSSTKPFSIKLTISSGNESASTFLHIYLMTGEPIIHIYESDINVTLSVPRFMDPRDVYSFKINVLNKKLKDMNNLNIKLESNLVNRQTTFNLGPQKDKTIDFTVDFKEGQEPFLDTLTVIITEENRTLYRTTTPIEVVSYRMPFDQKKNIIEKLLLTIEETTFTNKENVEKQQTVMIERSLYDKFFSSTDPDAKVVKKEGKRFYAWDLKLAPGDSTTISIKTSYRAPLYIILLLLLAFAIYYTYRDPIVILKQTESIKRKEGGIKELKMVLHIKNRSKKEFTDVKIIDKIPHIAGIDKDFDIGTLKPSKVARTRTGVVLNWDIDIEAHEERLLTYNVNSKLSILGDLRIPPALITFKYKGKRKKIKSNELHIRSEIQKKEE